MSTQLQHNQSINPTQSSSPTRHMAPCTLTDLIVPETCIPTGVDIAPERENILRKGIFPEEDGNRSRPLHNEYRWVLLKPDFFRSMKICLA